MVRCCAVEYITCQHVVSFVQDFDSYSPIHQVDLQLASVKDVGRCKLQLQTPQVQFK